MASAVEQRRPARAWLLGGALAALAVLGAWHARSGPGLTALPLYDYVAFWSAGRLVLEGENPYDPAALSALQGAADRGNGAPLVMWPAPWALTLLLPFSAFDAHASHLAWLLLQLLVLVGAVGWAWDGPAERRWVAWLVAFAFLPTYLVLVTGQLGALMLLGLVGFRECLRRGRPLAAGAFLALLALKPQLSYLFWIALLLWAWDRRDWRVLLGGALAGLALLAWPVLLNPDLPVQYWRSLTQQNATYGHESPLLGTALWIASGRAYPALKWAPTLAGLLWLAWYWRAHRHHWDWHRHLTPLLFASFLTTAYGAWPFDLVLFLPALLQVAVPLANAPRSRRTALALAGLLAFSLLALAQLLCAPPYFWFLWMAPALLGGYLLLTGGKAAQPGAAPG
jgi:hypothetical protein